MKCHGEQRARTICVSPAHSKRNLPSRYYTNTARLLALCTPGTISIQVQKQANVHWLQFFCSRRGPSKQARTCTHAPNSYLIWNSSRRSPPFNLESRRAHLPSNTQSSVMINRRRRMNAPHELTTLCICKCKCRCERKSKRKIVPCTSILSPLISTVSTFFFRCSSLSTLAPARAPPVVLHAPPGYVKDVFVPVPSLSRHFITLPALNSIPGQFSSVQINSAQFGSVQLGSVQVTVIEHKSWSSGLT